MIFKFISQIPDNKTLTGFNAILGMCGLTVFSLVTKLISVIKKSRALQRSGVRMEMELKEKERIINNYRILKYKENKDMDVFDSLFTEDDKWMHALYHLINSISYEQITSNLNTSHIAYNTGDRIQFDIFKRNLSHLIASRNLIQKETYYCARYTVATNQLMNLALKIGICARLREDPQKDYASGWFEFDSGFIEYLYNIAKKFDDTRTIDVIIAIKSLEIVFIQYDNDNYVAEKNAEELEKELDVVIKSTNIKILELVNYIPNTMVAIILAQEKSPHLFAKYNFDKKLLSKLDKPPVLLEIINMSKKEIDQYDDIIGNLNTKRSNFGDFRSSASTPFSGSIEVSYQSYEKK